MSKNFDIIVDKRNSTKGDQMSFVIQIKRIKSCLKFTLRASQSETLKAQSMSSISLHINTPTIFNALQRWTNDHVFLNWNSICLESCFYISFHRWMIFLKRSYLTTRDRRERPHGLNNSKKASSRVASCVYDEITKSFHQIFDLHVTCTC
jgi:hypothetical protein